MIVDMHAHYVPPKLVERVEQDASRYGVSVGEAVAGGQCFCFDYGLTTRPFFHRLLDLEERWKVMESQGIDRQVLQGWSDIFAYDMPPELGAKWHRLMNECLLEVVQEHPDRLSALASVPLQDADKAASELEHCVKQGGAVGAVVPANVAGVNLGEVPLDSFWITVEELDVPVYIHPNQPTPAPRTGEFRLNAIVHYTYDTTLTVGSLLFSGVLDRFPSLKLVLAHGGGYFPYQVDRFDRIYRNREMPTTSDLPPSAYLRRFHYDTLLHHPGALRYLADLVGVDRLLLGSDYPFPPADEEPMRSLEEAGFSAEEIALAAEKNAARLLKMS